MVAEVRQHFAAKVYDHRHSANGALKRGTEFRQNHFGIRQSGAGARAYRAWRRNSFGATPQLQPPLPGNRENHDRETLRNAASPGRVLVPPHKRCQSRMNQRINFHLIAPLDRTVSGR